MSNWIATFNRHRIDFENPQPEQVDIEDIARALARIPRFLGHTRSFHCVTPETRVLTDGLRWVRADSIKPRDGLVAFDEFPTGKSKPRRKLRWSRAEPAGKIVKELIELTLSDGTVLKSSAEHPWLTARKLSRNQHWCTAAEIHGAIHSGRKRFLHRFMKPWQDADSFEDGWLSGILDGEGHFSIGGECGGMRLGVGQNPGVVANKIVRLFAARGENIIWPAKNKARCVKFRFGGGLLKNLALVGQLQPVRLVGKVATALKSGYGPELLGSELLEVVSSRSLGDGEVVALETSTHTYFAEGFGAHNSVAQHSVGVCKIIPYVWPAKEWASWGEPGQTCFRYEALLHDAAEAYTGDLPTPAKKSLGAVWGEMEKRVDRCVRRALGCLGTEPAAVKVADQVALYLEATGRNGTGCGDWDYAFPPRTAEIVARVPEAVQDFIQTPLKEYQAKRAFMAHYRRLKNGY